VVTAVSKAAYTSQFPGESDNNCDNYCPNRTWCQQRKTARGKMTSSAIPSVVTTNSEIYFKLQMDFYPVAVSIQYKMQIHKSHTQYTHHQSNTIKKNKQNKEKNNHLPKLHER
jgi:hypothetical protein